MKEYNIEVLKDAAKRLLFDMSDEEYTTLEKEFDIVTKQMNILGSNKAIDTYEPMAFPFECTTTFLREDIPGTPLPREDALKNLKLEKGIEEKNLNQNMKKLKKIVRLLKKLIQRQLNYQQEKVFV